MRSRSRRMPALAVAVCIAVVGVLSGCSQSSSGSRHSLYESIAALAADSSSIVIGTVMAQSMQDGATVSSVEVTNAPANPQLGANLAEDVDPAPVGATVEVRQDAPPFLEAQEQYLLFLTPTGLSGSQATQFFITGSVAGLYVRDGQEFRRVVDDSGDTLPDTIATAGDESG